MLNFFKNKRKLKYIIVSILIISILLLSSIIFTIVSTQTLQNNNTVEIAKATNGYSYDNPYTPIGFMHTEGSWNTGFVIKETATGNEFVWVPVDGNNIKLKRSNFSKSFSIINPNSTQEDPLEPSFNVSVTTYGGFYVGRYEAGVGSTSGNNAGVPVCKKNATVWTNISRDNAKASATKMYQSNKEVISSLASSYAYDTMLTWLKTKNYNVDSDSSSWGNYRNSSDGSIHIAGKDEKKANNIYDIAGNVWEWTTENYGNDAVVRGGDALSNGSVLPAGTRDHAKPNSTFSYTGFRVLLYRDVNYIDPIPETTLVVAGGSNHTAYLDKNKTLWMWGKNSNGELGDGTTTLQKMPKHINARIKFKEISLSRGLAKSTDSNGGFSVGIDVDGFLYTWGSNGSGQLGTGNTTKVTSLQKITVKLNNTDVKFQKVSAGQSHCLAIDLDGNLWAWGSGADYRLGTGNTSSVKTPTKITSNIIFKEISASNFYNMALDKDDNLYTWGSGFHNKLCTGNTSSVKTPTKVTKTTNKFKKIAAGQQNSFAIDTNGYLWGCGSNYKGRLGIGDTTSENVTELKQIAPDKKFKDISAHGYTAMAIDTNGFLWGWGENKYSQLGTDKNVTPVAIKPISIPIGKKIQKISVGRHYFIAIDEEEKVWVCGLNTKNGMLGNDSTKEVTTPIKININ